MLDECMEAFEHLGIDPGQVYSIIAAVLWLGNVNFTGSASAVDIGVSIAPWDPNPP